MMAETDGSCSDPDCTGFHPPDWLADLAFALLDAARSPYLRPAVRPLVEQVIDQIDGDHLWAMCTLWAEAWRLCTGMDQLNPAEIEQIEGFTFVTMGADGRPDQSTATGDADAVEPGHRFAARFLLARVRRDNEQAEALANSVSGDRETVIDAVGHVLLVCAHGANEAQRPPVPSGGEG